jgi:hypothetical protein
LQVSTTCCIARLKLGFRGVESDHYVRRDNAVSIARQSHWKNNSVVQNYGVSRPDVDIIHCPKRRIVCGNPKVDHRITPFESQSEPIPTPSSKLCTVRVSSAEFEVNGSSSGFETTVLYSSVSSHEFELPQSLHLPHHHIFLIDLGTHLTVTLSAVIVQVSPSSRIMVEFSFLRAYFH